MHYSKETKKLVSCALIVASLVTITPMTARAGENRLEAEHQQEETEVQLSPVITVGEARKAKMASTSEAIWNTPKEESLATASNAVATQSIVIEVGQTEDVATASNAVSVEEVKIATASNAVAAQSLGVEKAKIANVDTVSSAISAEEVKKATDAVRAEKEPVARKLVSLGVFKTTGYCSCRKCSGSWGERTASGARVQERHTVAVDPRRIPYGTKLLINGITYTAEDCGSGVKGKHIDIYYGNHRTAQAHGLQRAEVFMVL